MVLLGQRVARRGVGAVGHCLPSPAKRAAGWSMLKFIFASCAALIALAELIFGAQASSPERCGQYARTAVAQYHRYTAIPGCMEWTLLPRWHENYDVHYFWCSNVPDSMAESEEGHRNEILAECHVEGGALRHPFLRGP